MHSYIRHCMLPMFYQITNTILIFRVQYFNPRDTVIRDQLNEYRFYIVLWYNVHHFSPIFSYVPRYNSVLYYKLIYRSPCSYNIHILHAKHQLLHLRGYITAIIIIIIIKHIYYLIGFEFGIYRTCPHCCNRQAGQK